MRPSPPPRRRAPPDGGGRRAGDAARWCKAWGADSQTAKLDTWFPGGGDYVLTFSTQNGNGTTKKSLFGRCVSLTTKKLTAERRAAREGAGGARPPTPRRPRPRPA